jgi:hypothetical protein
MVVVDVGATRNLRPAALVERLRSLSRGELLAELPVPVLLVRLDPPDGDVAQALEATGGDRSARVEPGMGFQTISSEQPHLRPASIPPPGSFGPEQLLVRLIRQPHFVVLVGKRADAQRVFSERVTVGRARNSDIVLRHESVSKFHAWFARDEDSAYFVVDASSRNGTWRNGVSLTGGEPSRVSNGDLIRFGSVETTFCDVATLHAALHA